ncbi:MAG: 50S ribosomal protein L9 [Gemmatimonadetes bacterium]|nr:50S ribosomal protein L9 [Gemmatimonadota bacterium]
MDVILRSDVAHLGKAGEVVRVKDGYARNYLIPEGLAYQATEGNQRTMAVEEARRATRAAAAQTAAGDAAGKLEQVQLTFTARVGEADRLFGSITAADIADKLGESGFKVDKRDVELDEPIRMIGVYKVPIRLHAAVRAEVRVWVVKE